MAINNKACGPRLRGLRYHIRENQWVYNRIRDLRFLDFEETIGFYIEFQERYGIDNELRACDPETEYERRKRLKAQALLACNDRYYLLTGLLLRQDMLHPWLFSRCREVEAEPDGYIDLWARGHGKTSIITVAGTIQQVVCDPEITIAIFSATKPLAQEILGQIKNEFETNEHLKEVFSDVLYGNPRMKGEDGRPAKWSLQRGITVKRKGKPKEATIEAHGLIDGQPTGRHFDRHHYDDIVTQDYLQELQLKKTAERFEMADNLGTRHGVAKQIVGTRYHFADVYGQTLERKSAKPRIHPATEDGTLNGQLVLLDPKNWERIKRDQGEGGTTAHADGHGGGQGAFFNPDDAASISAFTERLMPGEPGKPGAREAGVLNYIDLALAGAYADLQYFYRRGLAALDAHCGETYKKPFAQLDAAQQDAVITTLEQGKAASFTWPSGPAFFNTVRTHTMEGMFADPVYGGNKDFAGWRLVGFPGAQPVFSPEDLQSKNAFAGPMIIGLQAQAPVRKG